MIGDRGELRRRGGRDAQDGVNRALHYGVAVQFDAAQAGFGREWNQLCAVERVVASAL